MDEIGFSRARSVGLTDPFRSQTTTTHIRCASNVSIRYSLSTG